MRIRMDVWSPHLFLSLTAAPSCCREYFPDLDGSMAMWASSNMQSRYFRFGYDIAVPLPPRFKFDSLGNILPTRRKYFATFKVSMRVELEMGQLHPLGSLL